MINSTQQLSQNLDKKIGKREVKAGIHRQDWVIFPESQSENQMRWVKIIEDAEKSKLNVNENS